jgi:IS30 family transposase
LSGDGVRLSPDIRGAFGRLVKKGLAVTCIAQLFGITRQTVYRWLKRARHVGREYFKDKTRKQKPVKVTQEVELSILKLGTTFKWGTARIQQGICNLPDFIKNSVRCVQGVRLSRETINNVLARNKQNGTNTSLSAGNSLELKSQMSYGRSTLRVHSVFRARSTGFWSA